MKALGRFFAGMDDKSRAFLMTGVSAFIGLGAAFGLQLSGEQVSAITTATAFLLNFGAYLTRPNPPTPPPAIDPPGP